jgi:hypothetical protein
MKPITRQERLLNSIATGDSVKLEPITREEQYLSAIAGLTDFVPEKPITRKEMFYEKIFKSGGGGGGDTELGKPYIDTSKMVIFSKFISNNPLLIDDLTNIDTSNGTKFDYMFNGCTILTTIPQLDTSKGTTFSSMFEGCSALTTIPQLDTSKGSYFSSMFKGCSALTTIPQLDTSKGSYFSSMFEECRYLTTIPQLDTSNGTTFTKMFNWCTALEKVSLTTAKSDFATTTFQNCAVLKNLTIGKGWNVSIYLNYSPNLTVESLHGMIENLADLTGQTAKTFQIGATNLAKIDESHINMLQAKNWNYS